MMMMMMIIIMMMYKYLFLAVRTVAVLEHFSRYSAVCRTRESDSYLTFEFVKPSLKPAVRFDLVDI